MRIKNIRTLRCIFICLVAGTPPTVKQLQCKCTPRDYSANSTKASLDLVAVQVLSGVQLFVTPWTAACQASLSFTFSQNLLKLMPIESMMPSNHLILCCPLLLLPSIIFNIRVFSSEMALCIRWPKYWSFNFSISPSNKYSGLISFRIDWFDLLAVQGTLKSLPQHHNWKAYHWIEGTWKSFFKWLFPKYSPLIMSTIKMD